MDTFLDFVFGFGIDTSNYSMLTKIILLQNYYKNLQLATVHFGRNTFDTTI